jgi:hypothetical protein
MKHFKFLFFSLLILALSISCAKKQANKQNFVFNMSALQVGIPLNGGSYVRAISPTSNTLIKLDANDSAVFDYGKWEFQVVSFQGPAAFAGKRYCGRFVDFAIDANPVDAALTITEANCLSEPFVTLISDIFVKFNSTAPVSIQALSPIAGALAGGNTLTLLGAGFQNGATVTVGGTTCSGVSIINSTSLTCILPAHVAGSVNVIITNLNLQTGPIISAYTYEAAPTISSVIANAGSINGGTTITITGSGFLSGASVTFGGILCTLPIVNSLTSLTCTTPAHASGVVDVIVTNSDAQSGTAAGAYTFNPAPTITSLSPNAGALAGGTTITLTGANFITGATVTVGGLTCTTPTVVNATTITCILPTHSAGVTDVVVTNPDLQLATLTSGYTYEPAPTVTIATPNSGTTIGGNTVTISGTGFLTGATVTFGASSCTSVSVLSPTSLTCMAPATAASTVNITITNLDGQVGSATSAYTFIPPPVISSLTPIIGDLAGGTAITITGSSFQTGANATIGGANCAGLVVVNATTITCTTSAHIKALSNVVVINPDGQLSTKVSGFTYADLVAPNVSSILFTNVTRNWPVVSTPQFTWSAATDVGGVVVDYEIAIGSTIGATNIVNWTSVGNVTNAQLSGLSLVRGQTYFPSIRATDDSGNISTVMNGSGWVVMSEMWTTNGRVNTMLQVGSTLYIGGTFTAVGEWTGGGVPVDSTSGNTTWPNPLSKARVSGKVLTSISDGAGGFYIGGNFKSVNGILRNNIAHILVDGSVDPSWDPNITQTVYPGYVPVVYAFAISGSNLYIGGNFSTLNGSTIRHNLAAVNLTTGLVTSWNPNLMSNIVTGVNSLLIIGSNIYIGGTFTQVQNQTNTPVARNNIAAIDLTTGVATSWDPNINGTINSLTSDGLNIYAGGSFTTVNGATARNNLAAFDISTGVVTAWDPNADSSVNGLIYSGGTIYAAGSFTLVNGSIIRNRAANFDIITGAASAWDPNLDNTVYALTINGTSLYMGGIFTHVNGTTVRNRLAAFDQSTGIATAWSPNSYEIVRSITVSGTAAYLGGEFIAINGVGRARLAAIDLNTGTPTSFNHTLNIWVNSLATDGTKLYVGGSFTLVDGVARHYIAAFDLATGALNAWNPAMNAGVNVVLTNGPTIYAGGTFTTVGATTRNLLAAIDSTTGLATTWNPNFGTGSVNAMAINGSNIYVAGSFAVVNTSTSRLRLAALDLITGIATSWDPILGGIPNALAINGTNVYVTGSFTLINSSTIRNHIAAINISTGTATSWDPNITGTPQTLAIHGSNILVGGAMSMVNGTSARTHLLEINLATGIATSFNPVLNFGLYSILVDGNTVYTGGDFTTVNNVGYGYLAPIDLTTGLWLPGY